MAQEITDQTVKLLADDAFRVPIIAEGEIYGASWGSGYGADDLTEGEL